jgi:hypothetical protein
MMPNACTQLNGANATEASFLFFGLAQKKSLKKFYSDKKAGSTKYELRIDSLTSW